jgi:hypothetical protein
MSVHTRLAAETRLADGDGDIILLLLMGLLNISMSVHTRLAAETRLADGDGDIILLIIILLYYY